MSSIDIQFSRCWKINGQSHQFSVIKENKQIKYKTTKTKLL